MAPSTTTDENDWRRVIPEQASIPSFQVFTKPIQKSEQDERDYRLIRLDNGLKALLVHDSKADKAAAALDVGVGHLSDPDDMPGLAHFCEHLLFMGTEQFPRENEYAEYLAKNNGGSNAYTSTSNTNYYFNVSTAALPGALERFSGFFHSPLFAPSCTSRELNAVDSEHKKNHQTDLWRIFQLNKHLSKPGHVWSKFGSGSRESLTKAARSLKALGKLGENGKQRDSLQASPASSRIPSPAPSTTSSSSDSEADGGAVGRETRRRVVEWWTKEYCASRMNLCVIGQESLDELANMVSTNFSPVPNRDCQAYPSWREHPFGEKEKGTLVSVATVMTFHALEISFPLEWQGHNWRTKPAHFLSHFIGHEGPGSLHSYLKGKHWITALSSGPQNLARGFAMFKITVHLTEEGFKNYRDIVLAAFHYISLLRSAEFQPFAQHERVLLSQIRFRFAEKKRPDDYASAVAENMASPVPPERLISATQLTWDWDDNGADERKVREYLETFRLSEGRVVLMAKQEDHEKITPGIEWSKEPWYGTSYNVKEWESDFIEQANGPNTLPELYLPGPNEFIPTNLDVEKRDVPEPLKRPHLIRETPLSTLWHKKDDRFWVPKARIVIDIRSPFVNETARSSALSRLYIDLVNDSLTEFTYDADLAGLSYNLFSHSTGIYIAVTGYNDKVSVLLKHVLENIKNIKIETGRFQAIQEEVKREWRNFFFGQSYSLSDYYARHLLTEQHWTIEDKLRELMTIKEDELPGHINKILKNANLRMLVAGNVYKDEAIKIAEMAEQGLEPISPDAIKENALVLPPGSDNIWTLPIVNPNQANSAITYFVHFGSVADQRLRVLSSLLVKILSEPAFNVLRTREQLGYIVFCTAWTLAGSSQKGMRIVVQSEKFPSYLEERVEAFLDEMKERLATMSDEEFAEHKKSLERKWLEVDKNMNDEASRFISQINSGQLDFLRNENDARFLSSVTKQDVEELFLSKVHQSSPTRSKLAVHMISKKPRTKKVSLEAAERFEQEVSTKFPNADAKGWREALEENPTQTEFVQYWTGVLGDSEESKSLLETIPALIEEYPVPGEKQVDNKPSATYITDVPAFKAGLTSAPPTGPLVEWNDLPVPKF
ncbi:insulin-degrading enzyme [Coprinopsis cinerea okayama7|uniref:Insulin-degrading enzyme n=1 Tax=Coprinopsis cinerea (strain Okayama-7 / 130 / ATCC MYA-4618 / FGSC 9003) TaxID=240176 RepID=A8NEK1_COPC7|nr:insulin-degrading enzyme [Coprinopsis cinerea okayama7\|eukprot:XP_001833053.1 insulin-degrading enzyme [Coprinopsis cinerea okayama7\